MAQTNLITSTDWNIWMNKYRCVSTCHIPNILVDERMLSTKARVGKKPSQQNERSNSLVSSGICMTSECALPSQSLQPGMIFCLMLSHPLPSTTSLALNTQLLHKSYHLLCLIQLGFGAHGA